MPTGICSVTYYYQLHIYNVILSEQLEVCRSNLLCYHSWENAINIFTPKLLQSITKYKHWRLMEILYSETGLQEYVHIYKGAWKSWSMKYLDTEVRLTSELGGLWNIKIPVTKKCVSCVAEESINTQLQTLQGGFINSDLAMNNATYCRNNRENNDIKLKFLKNTKDN